MPNLTRPGKLGEQMLFVTEQFVRSGLLAEPLPKRGLGDLWSFYK